MFLALKQNARAPVLTLRKLKGNARDFLFAPEMDIHLEDSKMIEVDIFALDDGRVVVGEAKTVAKLGNSLGEKKAAGKLRRLATAVNSDVVVAATTTAGWQADTKTALSEKFPEGNRPALVLWENL